MGAPLRHLAMAGALLFSMACAGGADRPFAGASVVAGDVPANANLAERNAQAPRAHVGLTASQVSALKSACAKAPADDASAADAARHIKFRDEQSRMKFQQDYIVQRTSARAREILTESQKQAVAKSHDLDTTDLCRELDAQ